MSTISPALKTALQFFGAWPDSPYATINRLIYMPSILIMQYFQYVYIFVYCKPGQFQKLVDGLPAAFDISLTLIKLTTLWTKHRMVCEILAHMDTDWRECMGVEQDLHIMTTKASISHFFTNVMMSFYMFAGAFYFFGDYAIDIAHLPDNHTSRLFPMKLEFPSVAEQSPIYELIVVSVFMIIMLNSYTVATLNALIFSVVLHVSGQIDILYEELKTISEKVHYYKSSGHTIGMLIERHNKVIAFSDNMDKLFSFMALMQIFLDTLVVCVLGLLLISSIHGDITTVVKVIFAYSAIMMEVFIFCFAGEYLSLKSKLLAVAAYNSLWYNMSPNESKNILLIIMRSQKQLSITAGGMADLSLEVFATVMKTSASYASVLYAMY